MIQQLIILFAKRMGTFSTLYRDIWHHVGLERGIMQRIDGSTNFPPLWIIGKKAKAECVS